MRNSNVFFAAALAMAVLHQPRNSACSAESIQTIAFGSCNKPEYVSLWPVISSFNPQSIILLGDNMYADKRSNVTANVFIAASPEEIKIKYDVLEKDVDFTDMVAKVGGWNRVAATYDDHDFGINDGDKSYAHIPESQQLFWDFTEEPADSEKRKQSGVYSSKEYSIDLRDHVKYSDFLTNDSEQLTFTYKIVMLDTRSNRDIVPRFWRRRSDSRPTDGDFLGEEQWSWLAKELRSDVDLIILGSSIQLLPTDKFVEEFWGDVHYAEVSKMKCKWKETSIKETVIKSSILWELTSSGLTHTFYRKAPLKKDTLKLPADYSAKSRPQLLKSLVYNLYQASFPSHYRELRYSDHYSGMNFGLLDINIDTSHAAAVSDLRSDEADVNVDENQCRNEAFEGKGNSSSGCIQPLLKTEVSPLIVTSVTFRAMNHLGEAVITKTIPLQARTPYSAKEDVTCEPIWSKVSHWRSFLMYFTVFTPLVLVILATAAAFIFALRTAMLSISSLLKC